MILIVMYNPYQDFIFPCHPESIDIYLDIGCEVIGTYKTTNKGTKTEGVE